MDGQGRQYRGAKNGFREISSSLRDKIKVGDLVAGSYLPTERELQIDFGASRTTVRKALAALVESGWAKSIPNRGVVATRGLKPGQTRNVAFINTGSSVSQILLTHLCCLFEGHGLNLVAIGGRSDYPMEYGLQRAVENEHLGAIVWPNVGFPDVDNIAAIARQLPIVAIDHRIPGIETDLVTFDHEKAAFDATNHLAKQGAKRIGVTGMMDMLDISHDRFKGYLRALFANGMQPNASDFLFTLTSGTEENSSRVLEQVLRSNDRPDAFFVMNDICLPTIVAASTRAGLSLPRDIRLATVGDDMDVSVGDVRMTAVAFDWAALAENGVRLLLDRIEDLNRRPKTFVVPHRLKVRGLCGAPPECWNGETNWETGQSPENAATNSNYVFSTRRTAEHAIRQSRSGDFPK
jgi:LacI family transcriptional regulator